MTFDATAPTPQSNTTLEANRVLPPPVRKRSRTWIYIVFGIVIALFLLAFVAMRGVRNGAKTADGLIVQLHETMTKQDWDALYASTDEKYRSATTAEESNALFSGINRKLGSPMSSKQVGTQVNATTSGIYIRAVFQTRFSLDVDGVETVTWHETDGVYRVLNYNVNSKALISR